MSKPVVLLPVLLCLAAIISPSYQGSVPTLKTYYAGVVEFSLEPFKAGETSAERVKNIANAYSAIIASDEAQIADIIVFPEGTFNHEVTTPNYGRSEAFLIPDPVDRLSPCDDSGLHFALRQISCNARDAQKYIVINVDEKVKNKTENGQEKLIYYNTNVVFDREGVVISRYRKFHLFNEPGTSITPLPELTYFETDFNVTFGHFICFDILFKSPAMDLWATKNIFDFAYPSMWFSELPFMSAVQTQNMWATGEHALNLLAAGANRPHVGSTGSGIYSKNGPLTSIFTGVETRKILVAEVPKKQFWDDVDIQERFFKKSSAEQEGKFLRERLQDVKFLRDDLSAYTTELLTFPQGVSKVSKTLCFKDFCCDFDMRVRNDGDQTTNEQAYRQRIVVFDGVRTYVKGKETGGIFTCALISCLNASLESCGELGNPMEMVNRVEFQELRITGTIVNAASKETMPSTMDYSLNALLSSDYAYEETEGSSGSIKVSIELSGPRSDVYTFGFYGRDFSKDGMEPSSAVDPSTFRVSVILVVVSACIYFGGRYFDGKVDNA